MGAKMDVAQYQASQRLAQHREQATAIRRQLQTDLSEARGFFDPDLSEQGLVNRREQLVIQARDRAAQLTEKLRPQMDADTKTVRSWAEGQRPRVGDDAVGVVRSQQAWDRARSLLESGRSLPALLAAADRETTLAVAEWWPTWSAVQTGADPDLGVFHRSVDARLGELDPTGFGEAAKTLAEVEGLRAGFDSDVRQVMGAVQGGQLNGLEAALGAHYADQFARAGFVDDSGAEASQDAA